MQEKGFKLSVLKCQPFRLFQRIWETQLSWTPVSLEAYLVNVLGLQKFYFQKYFQILFKAEN